MATITDIAIRDILNRLCEKGIDIYLKGWGYVLHITAEQKETTKGGNDVNKT